MKPSINISIPCRFILFMVCVMATVMSGKCLDLLAPPVIELDHTRDGQEGIGVTLLINFPEEFKGTVQILRMIKYEGPEYNTKSHYFGDMGVDIKVDHAGPTLLHFFRPYKGMKKGRYYFYPGRFGAFGLGKRLDGDNYWWNADGKRKTYTERFYLDPKDKTRPRFDWSGVPETVSSAAVKLVVSQTNSPKIPLVMSVNGDTVARSDANGVVVCQDAKLKYGLNEVTVNGTSRAIYYPTPAVKPKPKPTPKLTGPALTWISCPEKTAVAEVKIKIGVKSSSPIKDYQVALNGSATRGIKAVKNDGYDLIIDPTLTLKEGSNTITVSVTNNDGTSTETRTIIYESKDSPTPAPKPTPAPAPASLTLNKIALVVGNGAYPEQPLRNTISDASAISQRLKSLGFEVIYVSDASKRSLDKAINDFGSQANKYDVAMFYYAGHGIQHNGDNYLVPVDATLHSESDVAYECTNVNRLLDKLEDSDVKMKIVALDACRNNPFERSWHRGASGGRGLSAINAPGGTFISYATSPGNVAADGSGAHSPYTEALLKALNEKDLSIEGVFRKVGAEVTKATGRTQTPWYASSLYEGNFIFNPSK